MELYGIYRIIHSTKFSVSKFKMFHLISKFGGWDKTKTLVFLNNLKTIMAIASERLCSYKSLILSECIKLRLADLQGFSCFFFFFFFFRFSLNVFVILAQKPCQQTKLASNLANKTCQQRLTQHLPQQNKSEP